MSAFAERLRQWRTEEGLSLAEAAKRMGYKSANSYRYLEDGVQRPGSEKLAMIRASLDVDADTLLKWLSEKDDPDKLPSLARAS